MAAGTPITLTPQQFAKTAAARKPGATYQGYLRYVTKARSRGTKTTPAATGLEQTPQSAINAIVQRIIGGFGSTGNPSLKPETDKQLQTEAGGYAQSQIQPVIDQLTTQAESRARRGMSSIGDLSKNLIGAIQPAAAGYENDALRSAAARSAIGQNLAGQASAEGGAQQSDVAAKLAQIGAGPASGVYADNAGKLGQQIASDVGVHGATGAADAVNRGDAEAGRASALPGIAALAGIRSGRLLQEETSANLKDSTGKVTAALPGLVSSIFENLKSRELSKENMREGIRSRKAGEAASLLTHLGDQNVQKALAAQGFGLDLTKLGVDANQTDTRLGIEQQNANTAAERAAAAAAAAQAKAAGTDANSVKIATSKALTKATSFMDRFIKPQPIYQSVLDNSTTPPTTKQVVTGYKGYPSYYSIIHQIESRIRPLLAPAGLTEADITMFAQKLVNANPHYKPGANGRPGTGITPPRPTDSNGKPLQ